MLSIGIGAVLLKKGLIAEEMDPKGKGMVVNNNEKESIFNEPKDDKPTDSGSSHKRRDRKKRPSKVRP